MKDLSFQELSNRLIEAMIPETRRIGKGKGMVQKPPSIDLSITILFYNDNIEEVFLANEFSMFLFIIIIILGNHFIRIRVGDEVFGVNRFFSYSTHVIVPM